MLDAQWNRFAEGKNYSESGFDREKLDYKKVRFMTQGPNEFSMKKLDFDEGFLKFKSCIR
jgi:hypothetical protein